MCLALQYKEVTHIYPCSIYFPLSTQRSVFSYSLFHSHSRYFHQTAPLLSSDPTLFCVTAYNYNAYPHTALHPSRLYRVNGMPAYGWMVRRTVAQEMVNDWPGQELVKIYFKKLKIRNKDL